MVWHLENVIRIHAAQHSWPLVREIVITIIRIIIAIALILIIADLGQSQLFARKSNGPIQHNRLLG